MLNSSVTEDLPPSAENTPPTEGVVFARASGVDTTFFMSRGGRQLMIAPMNELLAIAERLVAQARALGRDNMVPEFEKIAEAGRRLIAKFNLSPGTETIRLEMSPLLSSLIESQLAAHQAAAPPTSAVGSSILIVDDDAESATIVSLLLEQRGYLASVALTGEEALTLLQQGNFDLVLLDLIMPEMNGFQTLAQIRADARLRDIPVIIISGLADMNTVVKGIEMGADDFLPKPFNPVLLRARVETCLEKKRLHDKEAAYLRQIQLERENTDRLLLNTLPAQVAARLKQGESHIVDSFSDVTVLFADLADFSKLATEITATELVEILNEVFSEFDTLVARHSLEKIKTIGDAYMVVGGLPTPREDHAEAVAAMALDVLEAIQRINVRRGLRLGLRIGMHTGPVIAGIIGQNKFAYDLWGDTVNVANRLQTKGQVGCIQTSETTYLRLKDKFCLEPRGRIEIKGCGELQAYFLKGCR